MQRCTETLPEEGEEEAPEMDSDCRPLLAPFNVATPSVHTFPSHTPALLGSPASAASLVQHVQLKAELKQAAPDDARRVEKYQHKWRKNKFQHDFVTGGPSKNQFLCCRIALLFTILCARYF